MQEIKRSRDTIVQSRALPFVVADLKLFLIALSEFYNSEPAKLLIAHDRLSQVYQLIDMIKTAGMTVNGILSEITNDLKKQSQNNFSSLCVGVGRYKLHTTLVALDLFAFWVWAVFGLCFLCGKRV